MLYNCNLLEKKWNDILTLDNFSPERAKLFKELHTFPQL